MRWQLASGNDFLAGTYSLPTKLIPHSKKPPDEAGGSSSP